MMLTVPSILKQPARAYGADDDKSTPPAFSILYSIQITLNNRYWDTSGECRSGEGLSDARMRLISGHQSKKALKFISTSYPTLSKALTRNLSKRLPSEHYFAPGSKSVGFCPN
jgi:hypothetical protein